MDLRLSTHTFPASCRIRKRYEYQILFRTGRRIALPHFIIYFKLRDPGAEFSRLGLTVSRKVGNAVVRNRCKRHLRELFRALQPQLIHAVDLSVQLRPGAAAVVPHELKVEILHALQRAALVQVP